MNNYVDSDGVENVAVGIVRFAKRDFIKGAKILYKIFKRIPEEVELLNDKAHKTLAHLRDVRLTYDSWRFVKRDPYEMFGEIGEKSIINSWKMDAIVEYHKDLYMDGATIAYQAGFEKKKKNIHELSKSTVKKKYIKDKSVLDNFFTSRDYILNLSNGAEILEELNLKAYERSKRKPKTGAGRSYVAEQRKKEREKNKLKAVELRDSGMSIEEIARHMDVGKECIRRYFREIDSK